MRTVDKIVARVRGLPPEEQAEVLDFVESLNRRSTESREPRPYGLCAGKLEVPIDFDASLPESVLTLFEQ